MTHRGLAARRFSPNKPSSGVAVEWAGAVDLAEDSRVVEVDTQAEAVDIRAEAAVIQAPMEEVRMAMARRPAR